MSTYGKSQCQIVVNLSVSVRCLIICHHMISLSISVGLDAYFVVLVLCEFSQYFVDSPVAEILHIGNSTDRAGRQEETQRTHARTNTHTHAHSH